MPPLKQPEYLFQILVLRWLKGKNHTKSPGCKFIFVRFLQFILLPKLRHDIAVSKKVDVHLYAALKKAAYKPAALFKGLILPLCEVYFYKYLCALFYSHITRRRI